MYLIIPYLKGNQRLHMKTVAEILSRKNRDVIGVSPNTTVLDALKLMADNNIGSLLVIENGQYRGLMTERDYARKVVLLGKASVDTRVGDIMSTDLPQIGPDTTTDLCMQLMSSRNIRYLPVFEDGSLHGIVSVNDIIKAVIDHQAETISHLQTYIHS